MTVAEAIAWLSKCNPEADLRIFYPDDSDIVDSIEEVLNRKTVYLGMGQIDWEEDENLPVEIIRKEGDIVTGTKFRQLNFLEQE
jgi:hypothetical protein